MYRESLFNWPSVNCLPQTGSFLSLLGVFFFFSFIVPHIVGKIRKLENRGSRGNVDLETPATEKTIHCFL